MDISPYLPSLKLNEALAVLAYKNGQPFNTYRTLAEWLGCYNYIIPDKRVLRDSAMSIPLRERTTSGAFKLYSFLILLETHYTDTEQANIIRYILCNPSVNTPQNTH